MELNKQAVSPIIAMILLIMIMLVVTAGIMQWATPAIQRAQYEAQYRTMLGYFEALDQAIEDVVKLGLNSSLRVFVNVGNGELYFGERKPWRISWNESEERKWCNITLPSIDYRLASPLGTYRISAENSGIVTQAIGERWVINEPLVIERKAQREILICMINFTHTGILSGTAGSYQFNIRLKAVESNISRVSNFTIQIEGDWKETWYSHFLAGYESANRTGEERDYIGFADYYNDKLLYKTAQADYPKYRDMKNEVKLKLIEYDLEIEFKGG